MDERHTDTRILASYPAHVPADWPYPYLGDDGRTIHVSKRLRLRIALGDDGTEPRAILATAPDTDGGPVTTIRPGEIRALVEALADVAGILALCTVHHALQEDPDEPR
jgi:hypothetical protein